MYSLFIDTHSDEIVLILIKNGLIVDQLIKESKRHHSEILMPMINELLQKNQLFITNINEILVINGPGSFTGVRIGVTVAKMLGYLLDVRVKTMTTIDMYHCQQPTINLIAMSDGNGYYLKDYGQTSESYERIKPKEAILTTDINLDYQTIINKFAVILPTMIHNVNPHYIKEVVDKL